MNSAQNQEIQAKRMERELQMLQKLKPAIDFKYHTSPIGNLISITIHPARVLMIKPNLDEALRPMEFHIYLKNNFPFNAPRLAVRSHFTYPSLADGRDFLPDVLNKDWSASITLCDIANALPEFIVMYLECYNNTQSIQLGSFYLGEEMLLSTWDQSWQFWARELDTQTNEIRRDIIIVVTQTMVIQLLPVRNNRDVGIVIAWYTIQALSTLQLINLAHKILILGWRPMGSFPAYFQKLQIRDLEQFQNAVVGNLTKLGVGMTKQAPHVIEEKEVSPQAIRQTEIDVVLEAIAVYESNFQEKMTIDNINGLMTLYQQAIEYYSALNDSRYSLFLNRMHGMLNNSDVSRILNGKEEMKEEEPYEQPSSLQGLLDLDPLPEASSIGVDMDPTPLPTDVTTAPPPQQVEQAPQPSSLEGLLDDAPSSLFSPQADVPEEPTQTPPSDIASQADQVETSSEPVAAPQADPFETLAEPVAAPPQDPFASLAEPVTEPQSDPFSEPIAAPSQDPFETLPEPIAAQDPFETLPEPIAAQDPFATLPEPVVTPPQDPFETLSLSEPAVSPPEAPIDLLLPTQPEEKQLIIPDTSPEGNDQGPETQNLPDETIN